MIEKMRFISITGHKSDFDRVVDTYLNKYEIHLENAMSELNTVHDLRPFVEMNPYKDMLEKSGELVKKIDKGTVPSEKKMTTEEAATVINQACNMLEDLTAKKKEIRAEKERLAALSRQIQPFRQIDFDLKKILEFKFIKFRFGKISQEYFNTFSKYAYDNLDTVFFECDSDRDYVWGIYFVPAGMSEKIDAIYASLHFERVIVPDEYDGTPEQAYQAMADKMKSLSAKGKKIHNKIKEKLNANGSEILLAHNTLKNMTKNHNVRKLAACTKESSKDSVFFILCGWMTVKDSKALTEEIKNDPNVYFMLEDAGETDTYSKPPTKLRNPKLFKPFEMFIKMYGLPAYNEIDPTIFVAITYSLIFGIMFGDVGQGLCLVIGGLLLYKLKKMNIAAIISCAGVFSTIFGFMYGSVFGFEDLIEHIWIKPMDNVMQVLLTTVVFGVGLILIAMILNIINSIKAKDYGKLLFDTNGIAGLVFYGAAIACVGLFFTGHKLPGAILLAIFFGLPLILIFLREPLTHLIEKRSKILPDNKVMFFVESFFELFEVLLSYITNTISFLRVGAFALSHAAMMGVVLMLAGAESANPNIIVIILGNLLVAGMEGLIVGIQVLRLEYYEMFSRFYKGTGKEFKSFNRE